MRVGLINTCLATKVKAAAKEKIFTVGRAILLKLLPANADAKALVTMPTVALIVTRAKTPAATPLKVKAREKTKVKAIEIIITRVPKVSTTKRIFSPQIPSAPSHHS